MTLRMLFTLALLASTAPVAAAPSNPEAVAEAALKAAPVFDGHNDVPEALRDRVGNVINGFDFIDTRHTAKDGAMKMHTDLNRLRQGRVGGQFWSVYVDANLPEPLAVQQTMEQIDVAKRLIARYPGQLRYVTTAAEAEAAMKQGQIASLLGMEGGGSIGSSLAVLRQMHALGARYLTLTHWKTHGWADAATDVAKHGGLSPFGETVIKEMNRLGMIVDLSHVSEETMLDTLAISKAPVMFSHSGAMAINHHPRNVPDSVLAKMKANGGIVMVVFLPGYVTESVRQWGAAQAAEDARLKALHIGFPQRAKDALKAWEAANPRPQTSIGDVADHIDHIRKVAGIDHVGLGGDYDGMSSAPVGMEDVAGYPALFTELARRGYSKADLMKISSGNMLRVLRGVEATAKAQASLSPFETPVATDH